MREPLERRYYNQTVLNRRLLEQVRLLTHRVDELRSQLEERDTEIAELRRRLARKRRRVSDLVRGRDHWRAAWKDRATQ